ncbi:HAD-IC family P-type ATPase [Micrococcus luteus]|uniref:HAD-IC family P-type ATPase n=1 Tax=Micrococcus luteus TaxID=1270 RepID=UPI0024B1EC3D|nr:HAD-IC family P-type ATPase [Micrococcus luteus]
MDERLLGPDAAQAVRAQVHADADAGRRVLLLARTDEPLIGEALPAGGVPVAVVTFRENVRPDAAETLDYFHAQGVRTVVISGDSPRTVAAVAREVGLEVAGQAYDGRTLPDEPGELADVMAEHSVFGRVSPDQKKAMVQALQSRGHVVAMTGDGVNDALALKTADLGIAMGNAAPATKAVSRMVLLDGRFDRLPRVLGEGRQVIANMERLAHIYLTKTTYALLFGVVFSLFAWQFPLLPRQASTVDFIMIGAPTFFLALLPNPRRYVPGFLGRALRFAIPSGAVILLSMVTLQTYVRLTAGDVDLPRQQGLHDHPDPAGPVGAQRDVPAAERARGGPHPGDVRGAGRRRAGAGLPLVPPDGGPAHGRARGRAGDRGARVRTDRNHPPGAPPPRGAGAGRRGGLRPLSGGPGAPPPGSRTTPTPARRRRAAGTRRPTRWAAPRPPRPGDGRPG